MEARNSGRGGRGRRGTRLIALLCIAGLSLVLAVGLAVAASGRNGHAHHDHASVTPVQGANAPRTHQRAGFVQHRPTNLAGLKGSKPKSRPSQVQTKGVRTLSSVSATAPSPRPTAALAVTAIAPAPTITSTPTNPTYSTSASFSFTDSLGGVTFQCRLDNSSYSSCTSPKSYAGPLSSGSHTFRVRAVNSSGTSSSTTYSWTISRTPAPTLTVAPTNPTTERSASFSFTDTLAGVSYQCRLDGSAYAACTSPKGYSGPLSYGTHTFRVVAVSPSGTSVATQYSWSVIPPTPTITSQPPDPTTSTAATFSFADSVTGLSHVCSLDNVAFVACTSPKSYTALAVGNHTFQVRAVSSGGTQSASASYSWTISAPAPPTPSITQQPQNPSSEAGATFAFTDTDATATFECSLDNVAFAVCISPKTYSGLDNGGHTFAVHAKNASATSDAATYAWTIAAQRLKMKLLVISADGNEPYDFASNPLCSPNPCKGAIQTYLDQIGVPYDTLIGTSVTSATDLTSKLQSADGLTGNYYGIILATGTLVKQDGSFQSAFDASEWDALWAYEAKFHVRQATSYTAPQPAPFDYGLTYAGETGNPVTATLTAAGNQAFPYLKQGTSITFKDAYIYLGKPAAGLAVTPLVTDADGDALVSTIEYQDGRENLAVTAANAPWLLHTKALGYGIVNWVTRGVFLGSRRATVDLEIDDLLIDSNIWDTVANTDHDADPQNGTQYRLDATDWQNIVNWQNGVRSSSPLLSSFKLEWAFNGEGAFGDPTGNPPNCQPIYPDLSLHPPITSDTLTPAIEAGSGDFNYISHTYDHQNVNQSSQAAVAQQIQWNLAAAGAGGLGGNCGATADNPTPRGLNLSGFDPTGFVQPDISGLTNPDFLQAAFDNGIRSLITDTSVSQWNNPSPNVGFKIGPNGSILAVPRHPTNLFYALQTPDEWVDEYNCFFVIDPGSPCPHTWQFWQAPQTYEQIIDHESDNLLSYLITGDSDPWMFHQANLGAYSGSSFLLADLLNATLAKYRALYDLPIVNLTQGQAAEVMSNRMAYNASGVDGTLIPCQSVTLAVQAAAPIPVTGVTAGTTETYGGQPISTVQVNPGSSVSIPVSCS